jgi:glucose-6-phosphate-specific signal transduction histidine kinase
MMVTDNGIGAKQIVKGIGLAGMEERLATVGGSLSVSSSGGEPRPASSAAGSGGDGFRLKVEIPLIAMEQSRPFAEAIREGVSNAGK